MLVTPLEGSYDRAPHDRRPLPSVSVVVPVHNGGAYFGRCASALARAVGEQDEVVVVADGDSDGAWRAAEGIAGFRVHRLRESRGAAAARNAGARLATGEILLFVDADVIVPPDVVERVRQLFAQSPEIDAIIGSYDDSPADERFHSRYRNLLHHYVHQQGEPVIDTFWGAFGAVRRSAFDSVGGFDETYPEASIEDIELGYRLRAAGFRIRLVKELQVKHLKAWTPSSILRTDIFRRAAPWTELLVRQGRAENNLNLRYEARATLAAVGLLPFSLGLAMWSVPLAVAVAMCLLVTALLLNAGFYVFLARRCGTWFALRAVPWHLLYFASGLLGFVIGFARASGPRYSPSPPLSSTSIN